MRGRVLFAEDNEDLRVALYEALSAFGFHVQPYVNGRMLLDGAFVTEPPFVVLTDWMMPGCSGAEVLAELKTAGLMSCVPIVVLTADATLRDPGDGVLVLQKPCDLDYIANVLDRQFRIAEAGAVQARECIERCRSRK